MIDECRTSLLYGGHADAVGARRVLGAFAARMNTYSDPSSSSVDAVHSAVMPGSAPARVLSPPDSAKSRGVKRQQSHRARVAAHSFHSCRCEILRRDSREEPEEVIEEVRACINLMAAASELRRRHILPSVRHGAPTIANEKTF